MSDPPRDPPLDQTASLHDQRNLAADSKAAIVPDAFGGGRYRIRRVLGKGGQKVVYLAKDGRLDRDVVISVLKTDELDERRLTRLWREAKAMAQLGDHPNIVTVYDVDDEGGRPYIVAQYIDGGSMADLLGSAPQHRLPIDQVLELGRQICRALGHAHSRGIVHRDVKPANIWLTREGVVKLGDFGLALQLYASRVSLEGMLVGTVMYMSPEQAVAHTPEARSDLYSLGCVLYQAVTGRTPFQSDNVIGLVSQHANAQPVAPSWHNPEVPAALEALILELLAKNPDERPQGADEVERALAAIGAGGAAGVSRPAPLDTRSLARLSAGVFVGREKEIEQLQAALAGAESGRGRLVLVAGEPGSGKTRSVEQLATYARMRATRVLVGRCYEGEGAPAFWPWVQITRSLANELDRAALSSAVGAGAASIAQVVSEVRERLPGLPEAPPLDPEQARFRLFESITNFLKNAAWSRPVVVALDDLHFADKPSLKLLEFIAHELASSRLLVVATYRDTEVGRRHPLQQTLSELTRQGLGDRILLRGLTERDLGRFIELTAGLSPSPALTEAIHRETEGNPFFITEIVKLLVAEGRLKAAEEISVKGLRIPQSVREVIGRRLDRLSQACNGVLSTASVIGRDFTVEILEQVSDLGGDELLEVLEEAVEARILDEAPHTAGRYSFHHALIREALYAEISSTRRLRLHRRIGQALEAAYGARIEAHVAELAYHFCCAAPGGDVEKALDYSARAAERALQLLAYEEAAGYCERALEALDLIEPGEGVRRCRLLLSLADAHKRAGNTALARDIFLRAAAMAGSLKAPELLAQAALGLQTGVGAALGKTDEVQVQVVGQALELLGDRDSSLRVRLLAHLSAALYYVPERRVVLSQQAVEMARRVADPAALSVALYWRHVALVLTTDLAERLAVARELLAIAQAADNKEMELRARYRVFIDLMEIGDMAGLDREMDACARLVEELRQPVYRWLTPFFKACRAVLAGRFEECDRCAHEALAAAQRGQDPTALLWIGGMMNLVRVEQGRAEETLEDLKARIEKYPLIPGNWAILSYNYSHMRRAAEAREIFERVAARDFEDLPRDGSFIAVLASLSYVCHFLGDGPRAERIYALLLPYGERNIVQGNSGIGCGAVARALGLCAAAMGRWADAVTHYEDAIRMNAQMGALPFVAGTQFNRAEALLRRNEPGDGSEASGLLKQSLDTARRLGMKELEEMSTELLARLEPTGSERGRAHGNLSE
jgi:tetratricopeptide (TPR) repeat protein